MKEEQKTTKHNHRALTQKNMAQYKAMLETTQ